MPSGSFSTNTGVSFNLRADYSYSQNISNNTSSVTVTLYLVHNTINARALNGSYLSVAGNSISYSTSIHKSGASTTQLATKTVTVQHDSAGRGSCAIKAAFVLNGSYGGQSIGTLTLNQTLTLQTIPRSSSFSVPSSVNSGSNLNISIAPSSAGFYHKIRLEIDGASKYTSGFLTNSFSYAVPHSWVTGSTSKTMKVFCYTYTANNVADSNYIARIEKTTTINVPNTVVPNLSNLTAQVVDGINGKYVQGKSKIKLTATASGSGGASISSYIYTGDNINGSSNTYTVASNIKTSDIIQKSGSSLEYTVQAKDSRGRLSNKRTVQINVEPYSTPQITSISVQRCNADGVISSDGTYAYVIVRSQYSIIDGENTRTVVLSDSSDNYASQKIIQETSNTLGVYSGIYKGGFALGSTYTIKATIKDTAYLNQHSLSAELKTATRPINIAKYGNGVALGGMSTVTTQGAAGKFECNWAAEFNNNVSVNGFIIPEIQKGLVNIVPSAANTPTSKVVTFSQRFSSTPYVTATADTGVPGTQMLGVGVNGRSVTGVTVWITRTNTTSSGINWIAVN